MNPSGNSRRRSRAIVLAILSPALLALSGCGRDCDDNFSTPQTSDDCGTGSSGSGGRSGSGVIVPGRGSGGRSTPGTGVGGSERGGFGGFGRSFSSGS